MCHNRLLPRGKKTFRNEQGAGYSLRGHLQGIWRSTLVLHCQLFSACLQSRVFDSRGKYIAHCVIVLAVKMTAYACGL
uniref:Uncharacterized protein n=1 Tax=Anguilla anguilla TaxID=7936 RepID=A0A0E9PHU8_ANGAN